jgi:outer membrane protein
MRNSMMAVVLVSLILVGMPAVSFAADITYSVGAGAAIVPDYEGSDESEGFPLPYFSAQWKNGRYVKLDGAALKANLLASDTWSLGPLLQYRGKRDDDVDNNAVSRMREIDAAIEAGAFLGYKFDNWDFGIQMATDVSDEHDGMLATAGTGYTFKTDRMSTRIGVSLTYADDDYMDTYFSVDTDNANRSLLPIYKAESGLKDIGVNVMLLYNMTGNWDIRGGLGYIALLGDAEDSPIVDIEGESGQVKASIIVIYNF